MNISTVGAEKMKVYVILMHTGTGPSRLVRRVTHYPYSHVGLSLNKTCDDIYSFGRRKLSNFLNGGFTRQASSDDFFTKYSNTKCRIFELDVTDEQHGRLQAVLDEFTKYSERYRYDFCGLIIRTLFHIPVTFKNRYVCSHFVAEALRQSGIYDFGFATCKAKPQDFESMVGASEVYCGAYPIQAN